MNGALGMISKCGVATVLVGMVLMGCKGSQPASASSNPESSPGSRPDASTAAPADGDGSGSASSGGTRVEYISDPSLNRNAVAVPVPAGWKFHSIFMQSGDCVTTPFVVFRSASPDGWSMVERMPTMAWQWGQGPIMHYMPKNECLPMTGPMSAKDYLTYLAGTMSLHYDGPAPVPAWEEDRAQQQTRDAQARFAPQYAASGIRPPKQNRELARANVSYTIGTHPMKGVLDVTVDCMETQLPGSQQLSPYSPGHPPQLVAGQGSTVDKCLASANFYTAPASVFAATMQLWDSPSMATKPVDSWVEAWISRSDKQTRSLIDQMNRAAAQRREDLAQQFSHNMAVQQQMHNQFMQTMQESHDDFMARQAQNSYARDTAVSDWVDFALDRQTVINPNTGLAYKITNQVTVEQPLEKAHGNGAPWF